MSFTKINSAAEMGLNENEVTFSTKFTQPNNFEILLK